MHRRTSFAAALLLPLAAAASASAAPTIVVGPFATQAAPEYLWMGPALSDALTARLIAAGTPTTSQRQWAAVMRERDVDREDVSDDKVLLAVGRELGADEIIVGAFTATWPDVSIHARRVTVVAPGQEPVVVAEANVAGRIERLPDLEQELAKALFEKTDPAIAKVKGQVPRDVYAWHRLSLCRDALALQSLGPRARVWVPKALVVNAKAHCEAALKIDPKLTEAKAFLALAQQLNGETDAAVAGATAAAKEAREVGWPHLIAYYVLLRADKAKESDEILKKAIAKRPGFLHGRTLLGESLYERGELTLAKDAFEASLRDAPKQPWVLAQLGKVQARTGDVDGALATTARALQIAPDDPIILLEKASREIDGKRWKEAEATLRKTMQIDPRLAAAYLRLGYVYLETQQLGLAKPILEKAVHEANLQSEERVRAFAHYDLAKLFAREKNNKASLQHLKSAVKAGFTDRARIEADPDLAAVVKDASYATLWK